MSGVTVVFKDSEIVESLENKPKNLIFKKNQIFWLTLLLSLVLLITIIVYFSNNNHNMDARRLIGTC